MIDKFDFFSDSLLASWGYLFAAIAFEVAGTVAMKLSMGFGRLTPSILIFVFYAFAFGFLTLSLRRLEVGLAYAVWSGLGTVVVVFIGVLIFQDSISVSELISIGLILLGVIGLRVAQARDEAKQAGVA